MHVYLHARVIMHTYLSVFLPLCVWSEHNYLSQFVAVGKYWPVKLYLVKEIHLKYNITYLK